MGNIWSVPTSFSRLYLNDALASPPHSKNSAFAIISVISVVASLLSNPPRSARSKPISRKTARWRSQTIEPMLSPSLPRRLIVLDYGNPTSFIFSSWHRAQQKINPRACRYHQKENPALTTALSVLVMQLPPLPPVAHAALWGGASRDTTIVQGKEFTLIQKRLSEGQLSC